uniref:Putative quinone oxidoreductase yhdH n=1 Tax=Magnetococcus massalia (strain MO-1) TaxID=451514 RepID=A0A1S7LNA5_MAGMO|nr:Putative quinone oxidoreductase yhdH [Candidatus Magnetococcus massalia]
MSASFKALVLNQEEKKTLSAIEQISEQDLPEGDVLVKVSHSSLNYKDGLAVTGKGKIVRKFPHVPGIDLVGEVVRCEGDAFQPGEQVVLTGWGVGENHWGGYSEMARLKSEWLLPLPESLTPARAMALGTAGLTAMLCVMALERGGLKPDQGPVLVTGAAGGVGSVAVSLLAAKGYTVHAVTGRASLADELKALGAAAIVPREEISRECKPLERSLWAGAVDVVGGQTLATLISQMNYGAPVAACGLAGGMELPTTVFPFILRGVQLLGVDSVQAPIALRQEAWQQLGELLSMEKLDSLTTTIALAQVPEMAEAILKGEVKGRVVVEVG